MNVRLHLIRLNFYRLQLQELDETAFKVVADSTADGHSGTTRGLSKTQTGGNAAVLPRDSRYGVDAALGTKRLRDVQCFVLVLLAE